MKKCGYNSYPCSWSDTLDWLVIRTQGRSNSSAVVCSVLSATVYHFWRERNGRVFRSKSKSVEAVILGIDADIRACLKG